MFSLCAPLKSEDVDVEGSDHATINQRHADWEL
jgi:hypothetical protein